MCVWGGGLGWVVIRLHFYKILIVLDLHSLSPDSCSVDRRNLNHRISQGQKTTEYPRGRRQILRIVPASFSAQNFPLLDHSFFAPCPPKAALSRTQPTPPLPGSLLTGQLLKLRQDRLKEVIVDLVRGTVVPDEEKIFY